MVILGVGVGSFVVDTEYVIVGLEDLDIVSVADTLWVFVSILVFVCVILALTLGVWPTDLDKVGVAV